MFAIRGLSVGTAFGQKQSYADKKILTNRELKLEANTPAFFVLLLLLAAASTAAKNRRVKFGFLIATIVLAVAGVPERFGL